MFTHLLLAYDSSSHAQRAAQLAGQLAREQQPPAMVRVVVAMDALPPDIGEPLFSRLTSERTLQGQARLKEARELIGAELDVHEELLFGPAAEEIIQVAAVRNCDLIVIGSRGLGSLRSLLLGSHTQKVISHAPCPVLVVR